MKTRMIVKGWLRLRHLLIVLPMAFAVTACVTEQVTSPLEQEAPRVSAVAVSQQGFAVEPGESVAWRSEILWVGNDAKAQYRTALTSLGIKQEIENQLVDEGLKLASPDQADYTIIAAVVIGDTTDGIAVQELARLYPALGVVSQTLEKGSLMIALSRPGSPLVLWRGAVQTYISADIPVETRKLRLQSVVRSLLTTIPRSRTISG